MNILSILGYLVAIGLVVCHILVIVKMFQAGQTGLGVLCIILFFCCGIGILFTLIYGWIKAKDWHINQLMTVYTIVFVAYLALGAAQFNEIKAQVQQQLEKYNK
jgi:hypothetical protein